MTVRPVGGILRNGVHMTHGQIHIDSIDRIHDDGNHNAFTDLVRFGGALYLTFRSCPEGHMLFETSRIIVMRSEDAVKWETVFSFGVPNRDVRDPKFLVFRGSLHVYSGTWLVTPEIRGGIGDFNDMQGYCAWSTDGTTWLGPRYLVGTQGHYIWRPVAFGDTAYLSARRKRAFVRKPAFHEDRSILESPLLRSWDGFHWETVGFFRDSHAGETAFLFEPDGRIVAIARGYGKLGLPASVCRAVPPYREWQLTPLDRDIGGPLVVKWDQDYLVGGRDIRPETEPVTKLYWLSDDRLKEAATLPSGGDNSYPGFVDLGQGRALISYYSSHEGSTTNLAPSGIYLARLVRG